MLAVILATRSHTRSHTRHSQSYSPLAKVYAYSRLAHKFSSLESAKYVFEFYFEFLALNDLKHLKCFLLKCLRTQI